jgi:hypothetical protein
MLGSPHGAFPEPVVLTGKTRKPEDLPSVGPHQNMLLRVVSWLQTPIETGIS